MGCGASSRASKGCTSGCVFIEPVCSADAVGALFLGLGRRTRPNEGGSRGGGRLAEVASWAPKRGNGDHGCDWLRR